jgi:hypothetical protein
MFPLEFILFTVYLFCIARAFFPKQESEKTPKEELEDALTKYLVHIEKNATGKME